MGILEYYRYSKLGILEYLWQLNLGILEFLLNFAPKTYLYSTIVEEFARLFR